MLKCVIYRITPCCCEILLDKILSMRTNMSAASIELKVEEETEREFGCAYLQSLPYAREDILFVADNPATLRELLEAGCYAIAFYHERNQAAVFRGTQYAVEKVEELSPVSYEEAYRRLAGLPWDILETENLKVRESTVADVEDFYRIYAAPSITYYMEDLLQDRAEERAYMQSYIRNVYGFYGFGLWTVLHKGENRIIGRAGLSVREGYDIPELGFVIDAAYQKRGYGYEVCQAILRYARDELGFEKVQALVKQENTASLKLLRKLGLKVQRKVNERNGEYLLAVRNL